MMLALLWWVIFGTIAGWVATKIYPGEENLNFWQQSGLGILGSYVSGFALYLAGADTIGPTGLALSVLGAVASIYAYKKFNEQD